MAESRDNEVMSIRSLPHDDNAEKLILGTLLVNSDKWGMVSEILKESDFYSPTNREIYRAISDMVNDEGKQTFDGVVLVNYARTKNILERCGGTGYISSLTSLPFIVANLSEYCSIVKEASKRRILYDVSNRLQEAVFNPASDIREALEDGSRTLADSLLENYNQKASEFSIEKVLRQRFTEIAKARDGKLENTRIPSGFEVLDRYTNGGFDKEEYIIIAARPSIGKTAFALSMMHNMIMAGHTIAFFSLEMPAASIANRIFSIDSKLELSKIIKMKFFDDEFEQLKLSLANLYSCKNRMYIIDVPNINLTELRTKARMLKKECGIECIVIDYIGLISPPSNMVNSKKFEQVSYISLALKQLARELKIPVVVLCQVGRESEEQEPILSNLRDSGSIEQDADIVCFLHRKKNLSEEEKEKNLKDSKGRASIQVTKMIVAKNRNGETGYFKIGYNGPLTYYADVSQESTFIDYEPKDMVKKRSSN